MSPTATTHDRPSSSGQPPTDPARRRRRRRRTIAAATVGVVLVAAGAGVWWFLRDDAPEPVDLATASEEVDAAPATGDSDAATEDAAGTWTVDTSIGTFGFEESTGTFVGFRVEEELASIGSATAVGRTPAVSGSISIDGTTLAAATIEADMTAITTNDGRRDDRVQDALETSVHPTATFVLTEPTELGAAVSDGSPVSVTVTGELTIHGVTNVVSVPLDAQLVDGTIVVVGSLEVAFSDYGVSVPNAPIVVSAEDEGVIELQLYFREG